MIKKQHIKLSIILCISVATVFSIFSLIFYFGDWVRLGLVFSFGIFTGALAIPELEPKAIKRPRLFQTIVGAIGGFLATAILTNNVEYILGGMLIGAILGCFAKVWLEHMPIP